MIVLEGLPALSPFRRERLQARLSAIAPDLRLLGAWFTCWVEPETGARPDPSVLQRILEADELRQPLAAGAVSRYVVPRLGTISPWASKATELLHGASLPVKRVERGTRLDLAGWPADPRAQAEVARLLHDPMTQSLLEDPGQGSALFATPARGSVERIPLAGLEAANTRLGLALAEDEIEYLLKNYTPSNEHKIETLIDRWRTSGDPQYDPSVKLRLRQARKKKNQSDHAL